MQPGAEHFDAVVGADELRDDVARTSSAGLRGENRSPWRGGERPDSITSPRFALAGTLTTTRAIRSIRPSD
jgi:hypothetical protein